MIVHFTQRKYARYKSTVRGSDSRSYGIVLRPNTPNHPERATCVRLHPAGEGAKCLSGCWLDVPIDCIPELVSRLQDFYRANTGVHTEAIR